MRIKSRTITDLISTLGARVGWATGDADTIPSSGFTWLTRINATGEIALATNTIDASSLEDHVTRTIAGRADTGGTYTITVNVTPETMDEWAAVFTASKNNGGVWIQEWVEGDPTHGDFIFVQTPQQFPKSAKEQNALLTVEIECAIVNYAGQAAAVDAPV